MDSRKEVQHVYLVGAKSLGAYGGYETFVYKLTEYHQNKENIKYHVACKANGDGCMDENKFEGVTKINDHEFELHNAHCFKINIPQIGPAQAIYYDVAALKACCEHIRKNHIPHPIVYIMACRIGPFAGHFYKEIHKLGGKVYLNPDGHEWMRAKWSAPIRKYWKISEQMMVKYCDLAICDSVNIEKYIHECYDGKGIKGRNPKTTFIAYGADLTLSKLADDDEKLVSWYKEKRLTKKNYYLVVGRFVPENSFEVMIREFMKSNSQKDFALITTDSVLSNSEYYLNGREVKSLSNFCLYKAKNFSSNTLEFIDDSLVFNNNDELLIKCPKKSIEQIVIYGFIGSECERGRINLTLNNGFSRSFDFISKYGSPFNINIPRQNDIVWMRFHFSSKNKCKISRIEGFAEKQMNNSIIKPYIKILIDDNFTNHYYIPSKNRVLTVDLYRFKVEDSVNLKIVQGKADIINKNQIKILSLKKPIILRASCDSEPIYDQVTISKENNVVHNFKNLFNCVFLKLFRVNSHVYLFKRLCKAKGLKSAVLFYKRKMENK